ncbi:hypothetical protein G5V57_23280 [Nordella sp. HKS 07]|uniref:hypothetical protein n=1 Tax=Nordella sp. HKS 07 TaxID=2712222 RepID=UPI0013E16649|nr:hypothetical protein [Nordella sp. HKS 07]QIG50395.1 hypothetical protein G5V57_23280 [Nordella sp. HKS 07]
MPDGSNSIHDLRAMSELRRAELKETLSELTQTLSDTTDEIKTTLSPRHLKDEATAYARRKSSKAVEAVKENIATHPLQALAIGAIASYPFLGLVRKVPFSMVLIGAGLLLSRTSATPVANESQHPVERPDGGPPDGGEGLGEAIHTAFQGTRRSAVNAGNIAKEAFSAGAASAVSSAKATAADVTAQAAKASSETRDALARLVDRNPLLVAGVAMAVGGFIAASVPASRIEEDVLNNTGRALKGAGRKAAAEVVKGAKAQAAEIADDISAAAATKASPLQLSMRQLAV